MRTSKNWADDHLSGYADPKTREANRQRQEEIERAAARSRRLATIGKVTLLLVLVVVLGAAGLAVGDYTGAIPLGIVPRRQVAAESVASTPASPAPASDQRAPEPINLPPGVAAELLSGQPHRRPSSAPIDQVVTSTPAPAASPQTTDRARTDRVAHLDAGIALMQREQAECDRVIADQNLYLTMRPRPRPQPWNAAESLDELAIYLGRNPPLTPLQRADLQNSHDRWTAEVRNAKQRILEQQSKRASLQARIDKAESEKAQAQ
jgi:hypothetical protein